MQIIGSPEEITCHEGFISSEQLKVLTEPLNKSGLENISEVSRVNCAAYKFLGSSLMHGIIFLI